MIPIVKADGTVELEFIRQLKKRSGEVDEKVNQAVAQIIAQVKERGDEAVREYTVKFDGRAPENLEISKKELKEAENSRAPELLDALRRAAENIADFHRRQVQQSWLETKKDGVILGQRIRGLQRVGLYVPGGTAAYPSSVLMNAIPAKIAGVQELIMVTPPGKDGRPNQDILAAASIAGVDRVFLMGGAQAAAALAFGTQRVPKVDKIVGPGNIFVATAKKQLYGVVDIDMIAGPSEILVLADETAKPEFLAADLMSQAEHDKLASAILLTPSQEIAEKTKEELERQIRSLSRKEIIEASLRDFGMILVCRSMEEAVDFANELAPEHLEVCCANPMEYIGRWITPARCSWAITARNPWEIITRVRTTCCLPPAPQGSFLPYLWTASSRSLALFIIRKTLCGRPKTPLPLLPRQRLNRSCPFDSDKILNPR